MQPRVSYPQSSSLLPQRQRGRISTQLVLAGIVIVLVLAGMLYVTLQDSAPPVAAPAAGEVERQPEAAVQAAAPAVAAEAAAATPTAGNFGTRQLPSPVPTVSAQGSPVLIPNDEQRAEGVVIAGQLLEQIEKEAEERKAEAGAVPLSSPQ